MFKFNNSLKILISVMIFLFVYCNFSFASYSSRIKQIDQLIQNSEKNTKSTEQLDIPEYKGDTLTFERLSKIRNIFNIDHYLPFEKRKIIKTSVPEKKVVKLKPIVVPQALQKLMNIKPEKFQQYPLDSFTFKGTVYQNNQKWGVVENSREKLPIYLKKGELIGQNYGQIEDITKEGIVVDEWKKNNEKRTWEKVQVVIH